MTTTTENKERCLRCGVVMEWRHQTWQCPQCRFKLGCCEGDSCDG
jgi:rubrerythrin